MADRERAFGDRLIDLLGRLRQPGLLVLLRGRRRRVDVACGEPLGRQIRAWGGRSGTPPPAPQGRGLRAIG
jgi:hypothetical protein